MSTGDRVTKLYDVFQAGHLTEAEFLALKKEAFLPPPAAAPPINVSIGNASEFAQMQQQLTNIASAVSSLVASRAPAATIEATPGLPATKQRTPEVASKKVLLPDQRTLFDCGAKSTVVIHQMKMLGNTRLRLVGKLLVNTTSPNLRIWLGLTLLISSVVGGIEGV